jgi:hypothetical protein
MQPDYPSVEAKEFICRCHNRNYSAMPPAGRFLKKAPQKLSNSGESSE